MLENIESSWLADAIFCQMRETNRPRSELPARTFADSPIPLRYRRYVSVFCRGRGPLLRTHQRFMELVSRLSRPRAALLGRRERLFAQLTDFLHLRRGHLP